MSHYDDDDSRRHRSHRSSRRPVYEEEIIETRSARPAWDTRQMGLVRRRDDSEDSVEEVRRDFPPGGGAYVQRRHVVRDKYAPPARARSADRGYDRDRDYDRGGRRGSKRYDDRSSRRSKYESDSESDSPPPRHRRKSLGEQALAALGLGGAAAALTGDKDKDRSSRARSRSRARSGRYESRSRSRSDDRSKKIQQAVKAALAAGAVEAFRSRKEPGGLAGQGKRVLTAAIGAAGIDGMLDKDPNHHSTRHTIEAAIGGLAGNRLINGARSRSRSRGRNSRDDKGSIGAGGLAAGAGLAALAGKAIKDYRERSKSRGRGDRDYSDDESRSPDPARRKRSSSVSAFVSRGLAKVGLGDGDDKRNDRRSDRNRDDGYSRGRGVDNGYDNGYNSRPRGGGYEEKEKEHHDSSTDYSSSEEEKKQKKMRTKELVTAGLASVATIHAAHSVYQTREKRMKRAKLVQEGKMSPEEAQKLKKKGLLQDAASVGIAALGIKGAYSEWKEMNEQRHEFHHMQEELEEKRARRREKERQGQRQDGGGGSNRRSEPDMNRRYIEDYGPRYADGNPYASGALPPLPMGSAPMRY